MDFQLDLRVAPRPEVNDDQAWGRWLVAEVRSALSRGAAPPAAVVLRPERMELILLEVAAKQGLPSDRLLAGLTRSAGPNASPPEAVAVIGVFQRHAGGAPLPSALVFVEWPDCSWWSWSGLIGVDGRIIEYSDEERQAAAGDALPDGLGRWWSAGRREGISVRLAPLAPKRLSAEIVH